MVPPLAEGPGWLCGLESLRKTLLLNAPHQSSQGFRVPPSAMKTSGLCSPRVVADGTFSSCGVGGSVPARNGPSPFFLLKEVQFWQPPSFVLCHLPPK